MIDVLRFFAGENVYDRIFASGGFFEIPEEFERGMSWHIDC
jgi:hypothetical protein